MPNQKANEKKVKARTLESHFTAISVFEVAFSFELPKLLRIVQTVLLEIDFLQLHIRE